MITNGNQPSQELIWETVIVQLFVNLDNGTKCTTDKFVDNRKWGVEGDTLEGETTIGKDLDRLGKMGWQKFQQDKWKILYVGGFPS